MRIWRRLQRIGAIAVKNSVYVLPPGDQAREDFEWVLREIVSGGAEGAILEAGFVSGLDDAELVRLFNAAREADYDALSTEVREFGSQLPKETGSDEQAKSEAKSRVTKFKKRLHEIDLMDFFGADGRETVDGIITELANRLAEDRIQSGHSNKTEARKMKLTGKIWVTRERVGIDRIASAWLIKKWIDESATFKFTGNKNYKPAEGELRFDMFDAEITHEGDKCTFEVLLERAEIDDPALRKIAEIVHDIDLKDAKYNLEETLGISHLITGLTASTEDDVQRLKQGGEVFSNLYNFFSGAGS